MTEIPAAEMGRSGGPGRGLEYARPAVTEEGYPAIQALCDCATTTILQLDPDEVRALTEPHEVPYQCDGCETVHWLTIYPIQEGSP